MINKVNTTNTNQPLHEASANFYDAHGALITIIKEIDNIANATNDHLAKPALRIERVKLETLRDNLQDRAADFKAIAVEAEGAMK